MSRRQLILVFVLASGAPVVAMMLVTLATARAGTIAVVSCRTPAGAPAPTEGWEEGWSGTAFPYAGDSNECAHGGSLSSYVDDQEAQPGSSGPYWQYTPPAGDQLVGGWVSARFVVPGGGDNYTGAAGLLGPKFMFDASDIVGGLPGGNPGATEGVYSLEGHTGGSVWIYAFCEPPNSVCPAGDSNASFWALAEIKQATIELNYSRTPQAADFAGTLLDGTASDIASLEFTASEAAPGPGIYWVTVTAEGRTLYSGTPDDNQGRCMSIGRDSDGVPEFLYPQPCPLSEDVDIPIDTTVLAAGQHDLRITVIDAGGVAEAVYDGKITTSGPPNVGVNDGAISGRGTPNGEPCAGEALELAVNGRRRPPSSILYGKPVTIKGVLHCGTVPIRDARITVNTLGAPASAAIDTTVQTALDGSFTYKVPTGPDRTLSFSYTAYSNDPGPSATATVTIAVRPKIRLRIRPTRTSNGKAIHWSGTITGGPYPPQGVTLDIEVREGRRWRFFDQTVAGRRGRFHYSYRFHATTEPTTYTFRVALPDTGARGYPYTHGASNTVNVHVRP
jgi:hypothetical protein